MVERSALNNWFLKEKEKKMVALQMNTDLTLIEAKTVCNMLLLMI